MQNYALEAVENANLKVEAQINKDLLPRIKEIVTEIANSNYDYLHELKGIYIGNTPEGSGPDNDIFSMDVKGGNLELPLQTFLSNLVESVEEYLKKAEGA